MSMMGFLVLAGVVVNNGIVFVDYVNQLVWMAYPKKTHWWRPGLPYAPDLNDGAYDSSCYVNDGI